MTSSRSFERKLNYSRQRAEGMDFDKSCQRDRAEVLFFQRQRQCRRQARTQEADIFFRSRITNRIPQVRVPLSRRQATFLRTGRKIMNRRTALALTTMALSGVALSAGDAMAQQRTLKEQLV